MARISLHRYSEEARQLIESRAYDDAIAICRAILKRFPKHVETYRILGEACLEKGELDEATDIFKRLLSADPENFVAYAGLGVIHEQNQQLAQAVWHMERAFELAPNNEEIRNALRRLYSQRDGAEPVRIKLNKVALARLYARGGQFRQAIEEFGRSLELEPGRLDIQLSLTETLWRDDRREQAVELAREILKASPDCLKAILLLGAIQIEKGRTEEGQGILACARALDPENRMAQALFGDKSPLPMQDVMVPRTAERIVPVELPQVPLAEGIPEAEEAMGAIPASREEPAQVVETPVAALPDEPLVTPPAAAELALPSEPEEPAQAPVAETMLPPVATEQVEAAPAIKPAPVPEESAAVAAALEEAEASPPAAPAVTPIATESAVFPVQTVDAAAAGPPEEQAPPGPELCVHETAAPDVAVTALQEPQGEPLVLAAPESAPIRPLVHEVEAEAPEQPAALAEETAVPTPSDHGLEAMVMPHAEATGPVAQALAPGLTTETPTALLLTPHAEVQTALTPQVEAIPAQEPEAGPTAPWEAPTAPSPESVAVTVPTTQVEPEYEPETEEHPVEAPVFTPSIPVAEPMPAAAPELQPAPAEVPSATTPVAESGKVVSPEPGYPEESPDQPEPRIDVAGPEPAAEMAIRPTPEAFGAAEPMAPASKTPPPGSPPIAEALAARPSVDIERYRQQLKQNPKDDLTRLNLARVYRDQEQIELALEQYRVLERAKPELLSEVIVDMEGIVASRPGNLTAHEALGDLYTKNGLLQKALARYRWLLVQYDQKPA